MMRSLIQNDGFRAQFINRFYEVICHILTPDYLASEFEYMFAERDPLMQLQEDRWGNYDHASVAVWHEEVEKIRKFIDARSVTVLRQFFNYFDITENEIDASLVRHVSVSFNNLRINVIINSQPVRDGQILTVIGNPVYYEVEISAREKRFGIESLVWLDDDGTAHRLLCDGSDSVSVRFTFSGNGTLIINDVQRAG